MVCREKRIRPLIHTKQTLKPEFFRLDLKHQISSQRMLREYNKWILNE